MIQTKKPRKWLRRWGGWLMISALLVILAYVAQRGASYQEAYVETAENVIHVYAANDFVTSLRQAALAQAKDGRTEQVERIFATYGQTPEFRQMERDWGYHLALPYILQCWEGLTPQTPDAETREKVQCGWRVVRMVLDGPRSQALLRQNAKLALRAHALYGHTGEWHAAVEGGNAKLLPILGNCLEGAGDRYLDASHAVVAGVKSLFQGERPAFDKLTPTECGWYALQRAQQMGDSFFTQFVLNDKGEAERLPMSSLTAAAKHVLFGHVLQLEEKVVLKKQVTAGDVGLSMLDVAGIVAIVKLPAMALKAVTLGGAKVGVTAAASATAGAASMGFALVAPVVAPVVATAGLAYVVTHPQKVGDYIGKPISRMLDLPEFLGGLLGWAIVAYLARPLWLPLVRWARHRIAARKPT